MARTRTRERIQTGGQRQAVPPPPTAELLKQRLAAAEQRLAELRGLLGEPGVPMSPAELARAHEAMEQFRAQLAAFCERMREMIVTFYDSDSDDSTV